MHMRSSATLSKVHYWLKDKADQNFGDYLTEFFLEYLFLPTPSEARGIHLVGSVLDDMFVSANASQDNAVVFWGCGLRTPDGLSEGQRERIQVLAVRGPLSRSQLRLGAHIPYGDPGFLVAALYDPKPASAFAGRRLCIPHFLDRRSDADLLTVTGCDLVLRPNIDASLDAIGRFIDAVAAAAFVLTASLHGAVMAAAYHRPFGFWDSGRIDLPFKWADLAASMGLDCVFHPNLESAAVWHAGIENTMCLPETWRLLINPPLLIRPEAMLQIARHYTTGPYAIALETFTLAFAQRNGGSVRFAERMRLSIGKAEAVLGERNQLAVRHEVLRMEQAELRRRLADAVAQHAARAAEQQAAIDDALARAESHRQDAAEARLELSRLGLTLAELDAMLITVQQDHHDGRASLAELSHLLLAQEQQVAVIRASTSWRLTLPLRHLAKRHPASSRVLRRLVKWLWRTATLRGRRPSRAAAAIAAPEDPADLVSVAPPAPVHTIAMAEIAMAVEAEADIDALVPIEAEAATEAGVDEAPKATAAVASPPPCHLGPHGAPKALIIDSRYPRTDRDSGSLDAFTMIGNLQSLGYGIFFVAAAEYHEINAYGIALQALGVTIVSAASFDSPHSFLALHGGLIALAILSRADCGGQFMDDIRRLAPQARVVFNPVDLHHIRMNRQAALLNDRQTFNEADRLEERERYLIRMADVTFVVASSELREAQRLVPGADIVLTPIARPIPGRRAGFHERAGIGFIGGFDHRPNLDAVQYFLDQIWPKVRALVPDASFHVIGADMPPSLRDLIMPGVDMVGFVPALDPWLERLKLTVAPLRFGAGAKGKVVSSFSAGLPCVMSQMAAEGMDIDGLAAALLAEDPDAVASLIARLYHDPAEWRRLSDACLALARDRHSLDHGRRILAQVLGKLGLPAAHLSLAA